MSRFARRLESSSTPTSLHFSPSRQSVFPDRRFWTHAVFNALPDYSDNTGPTDRFYGALYPLELVKGNYSASPRPIRGAQRLINAGITGLQVLLFQNSLGIMDEWLAITDATFSRPNPNEHILFAGCLQADDSDPFTLTQAYVQRAEAGSHPSIAKINGAYVVYVFGSTTVTAAQWQSVRERLVSAGIRVHFIFDYQLDASQYGNTITAQNETRASANFPYTESNWLFDDSLHYFWPELVRFVNKHGRSHAGGIMPGYNRETKYGSNYGGYRDAMGTKVLRTHFNNHRDSEVRWQNIISWSDIAEHHEVRPTSTWNHTRADICAFYAAIHRGIAFPKPRPELYVTTPQAIFVGDTFGAEAMVLNGAGQPVTATVRLLDSSNNQYDQVYTSAPVRGGYSGDVTTPNGLVATAAHAGKWFRAHATLRDQSGAVIQEVTSAPILVYAAGTTYTEPIRRLYYSIPAYAALPEKPTLSLSASPVSSPSTARATVSAPSGQSMRFLEVLQNTRQAWLEFDKTSYTTSSIPDGAGGYADKIPMGTRKIYPGDQHVTAAASGFYVARLVDNNERVGYSDPVYVN